MLEMRLMGTQEDIERFLNEIFYPKYHEEFEKGDIKISKNDGKYYDNEKWDKCYKRRYIRMYWKSDYESNKDSDYEWLNG